MKKLFTLLCFVAMICVASGQSNRPIEMSVFSKNLKPAPAFQKKSFQPSSSRAASYSLALDYDDNDETLAGLLGVDYQRFLWSINRRWGNTDNLNLDYAAVSFDTLQYVDQTSGQLAFFPRASSTTTLDSFAILFIHDNTTGNTDSLSFTVFKTGTDVIANYGAPNATYTTPSLWDTLIITNTTIPLNTQNYTLATFYPNVALAQGESFGIRVDFAGDTANAFNILAGYRDPCFDACAAEISCAGNNTGYYLNLTQQTTNLSGFYQNNSVNGAIFFDCDMSGGNGPTPGACENFYIQNAIILPFITSNVNFGATVISDSTRGCPGTILNLSANGFGSTATPFTYNWSTNSGTLSTNTDQNVSLVIANTGSVTVTVTDANGDSTVATQAITSRGLNVTITNANPFTIACGSNGTLTSNVTGTQNGKNYVWSTGTTGSTAFSTSVSTPGTYTLVVTNSFGCSASASVNVIYTGGVTNTVNFNIPPSPICQGRAYTYDNASTYTGGLWSATWDMKNDGSDLQFQEDANYTFTTAGTYTIKLTMDSAGCTFTRTRNVTITAATNSACNPNIGFEDLDFSNEITLQPNPSYGNVNVTVNGVEKNLSIRVYNIIGSEVKTFIANEISPVFSKSFDFSDLANGAYIVKIQSGDKTALKRLTIGK